MSHHRKVNLVHPVERMHLNPLIIQTGVARYGKTSEEVNEKTRLEKDIGEILERILESDLELPTELLITRL